MNICDWLQNLSTLVGLACKRYPLNVAAMCRYLAHRLQQGDSYHLLILRELLLQMTGTQVDPVGITGSSFLCSTQFTKVPLIN